MKRGLCVVLAVVLLLSASTIAYAVTPRSFTIMPNITFDGTTATCEVRVIGNSTSETIKATIKLWQGSTCLETWTVIAFGGVNFSDTVSVTKGMTYTLTVDVTVNGVSEPTASTSGTC